MKSSQRLARLRGLRGFRSPAVASTAAVTLVAALVIAVAGWRSSRPGEMAPDGGAAPAPVQHAVTASKSGFSSIILPDLLIVLPSGLTKGELTRLHAIKGVRKLISFDGAQITVDGNSASVIGVNPVQFRSWVPLGTASNQPLWTELAAGDFIAATSSASGLGLTPLTGYQLTGANSVQVDFGGPARLDISGVDLVVNQSVSRRLGLVHQVAALLSAPGSAMSTLMTKVRRILGSAVKLVSLRDRAQSGALPATTGSVPSHITSYLQLFQASSAKYCPSLSWTVLAAIGQIESGDGTNEGPSSAGALGPMQFEPSTWAQWGIDGFGQTGPPDIMNPFDAVPSAARYLCAAGASSGSQAGLRDAVFAYNHADWYVSEVLNLAAQYAAEYH
jgi:hypothetical protein